MPFDTPSLDADPCAEVGTNQRQAEQELIEPVTTFAAVQEVLIYNVVVVVADLCYETVLKKQNGNCKLLAIFSRKNLGT